LPKKVNQYWKMLLLLKAITLKSTTPSKRKIQKLLNAREYTAYKYKEIDDTKMTKELQYI